MVRITVKAFHGLTLLSSIAVLVFLLRCLLSGELLLLSLSKFCSFQLRLALLEHGCTIPVLAPARLVLLLAIVKWQIT